MRTLVRATALAAVLPLAGCAAAFGGYDTAPNGLPRGQDALRRDLATRPAHAYSRILDGQAELPEDDLLRLLFAGSAGRYAGAYRESGHLLDIASYLAEDRVTTSVSREVLSMISSDRALAYTPGPTERVMIHYTAATAYLEAGDYDAAAVEARRIEARLDHLADAGDSLPGRPFLHTLAGAIFDAAGDHGAAEVAYRRAAAAGPAAMADPEPVEGAEPGADPAPAGEVVVLVETGRVPHRVEQSVVVVLPPRQVSRLTEGDVGDRAAAALDAAGRVLLAAAVIHGGGRGYYRDYGFQRPLRLAPWERDRCKGDDCGDDSPYLLRISWPVLYQPEPGPRVVRLHAGDRVAEAESVLDVAEHARRDFDAERPTVLARTLARATSKVALSAAARKAVEKKDEGAAEIVGLLTNLGTALTERADTRCWHLLPGRIDLLRLALPEGTHDLSLELGGRTVPLGAIDVVAGRTTVLTHRVW